MSRRRSIFVVNQENQAQIKVQEEVLSNEIDKNLRCLAFHFPIEAKMQPHFAKVSESDECLFNPKIRNHLRFVRVRS